MLPEHLLDGISVLTRRVAAEPAEKYVSEVGELLVRGSDVDQDRNPPG